MLACVLFLTVVNVSSILLYGLFISNDDFDDIKLTDYFLMNSIICSQEVNSNSNWLSFSLL